MECEKDDWCLCIYSNRAQRSESVVCACTGRNPMVIGQQSKTMVPHASLRYAEYEAAEEESFVTRKYQSCRSLRVFVSSRPLVRSRPSLVGAALKWCDFRGPAVQRGLQFSLE